MEEVNGLLLEHQIRKSMQSRHTAQHVRRVFKTLGIDFDPPMVGEHCAAKAYPRSLADRNQPWITAVDQIITEHEPEVSWMVQNKRYESKTYSPNIGNTVIRVTGLLNVSICPFKSKNGNFREQSSCIAEVVCWSGRRDTRPLRGCAKRKCFDSVVGNDVVGSLYQRSAKVTVMIRRSFPCHARHLS